MFWYSEVYENFTKYSLLCRLHIICQWQILFIGVIRQWWVSFIVIIHRGHSLVMSTDKWQVSFVIIIYWGHLSVMGIICWGHWSVTGIIHRGHLSMMGITCWDHSSVMGIICWGHWSVSFVRVIHQGKLGHFEHVLVPWSSLKFHKISLLCKLHIYTFN